MWKKLDFQSDIMATALVIWLCTLPLIAVTVVPLFGTQFAALIAVGLLIAILLMCWGKCGWRLAKAIVARGG